MQYDDGKGFPTLSDAEIQEITYLFYALGQGAPQLTA